MSPDSVFWLGRAWYSLPAISVKVRGLYVHFTYAAARSSVAPSRPARLSLRRPWSTLIPGAPHRPPSPYTPRRLLHDICFPQAGVTTSSLSPHYHLRGTYLSFPWVYDTLPPHPPPCLNSLHSLHLPTFCWQPYSVFLTDMACRSL